MPPIGVAVPIVKLDAMLIADYVAIGALIDSRATMTKQS
jgi:hypothetical protein